MTSEVWPELEKIVMVIKFSLYSMVSDILCCQYCVHHRKVQEGADCRRFHPRYSSVTSKYGWNFLLLSNCYVLLGTNHS